MMIKAGESNFALQQSVVIEASLVEEVNVHD